MLGGPAICSVCEGDFELFDADIAPRTETEPLDGMARLYRYKGRAAQAVQRLKYARCTSLIEPMARRLADYAEKVGLLHYDLFVPVPIHASRRRFRGFNQSEAIARYLPVEGVRPGLLVRTRPTMPQTSLSHEERLQNLKGAFHADPAVREQHVVLVDDVLTSGQTALECARALKAAGAREVVALTFCGG
ncbi:MAG: ComF family protein [Armatimonadetes bacterium]|nr:ComF family protein [Armatimonadota bacterium]